MLYYTDNSDNGNDQHHHDRSNHDNLDSDYDHPDDPDILDDHNGNPLYDLHINKRNYALDHFDDNYSSHINTDGDFYSDNSKHGTHDLDLNVVNHGNGKHHYYDHHRNNYNEHYRNHYDEYYPNDFDSLDYRNSDRDDHISDYGDCHSDYNGCSDVHQQHNDYGKHNGHGDGDHDSHDNSDNERLYFYKHGKRYDDHADSILWLLSTGRLQISFIQFCSVR